MEIIIDGKIVSIKHYLNKTLSPVIEDGKTKYPLYTQVIFDKNNTRFKAIRDYNFFKKEDIYIDENKEDILPQLIAQNTDPCIKGVLDTEKRLFKIIEKELNINHSSLKGLAKKAKRYGKLLSDILRVEAEARLLEVCRDLLIYNDYIKVDQARSMIEKYNILSKMDGYKDFIFQLETEPRSDLAMIRASILIEVFEQKYGKAGATLYSWFFENGEKRYVSAVKESVYKNWTRYSTDFDDRIDTDVKSITTYLTM